MSKKESDTINLIDISQSTLVYFLKTFFIFNSHFTHRLYLSPMSPLPLLQVNERQIPTHFLCAIAVGLSIFHH